MARPPSTTCGTSWPPAKLDPVDVASRAAEQIAQLDGRFEGQELVTAAVRLRDWQALARGHEQLPDMPAQERSREQREAGELAIGAQRYVEEERRHYPGLSCAQLALYELG